MKDYPFHEVANLFPLMSGSEFGKLCKDIAVNGLLIPIWLHDNQIIDGRNRYNACREVKVEPKFAEWDGEGSLVGFVVSLNLTRRQLTASQKAAVAHEMLPMLEKEAKERQRAAGVKHAGNLNNQDSRVFQQIEKAGEPFHSVEQAAKAVGVNKQYVSDMKTIERKAPEKVAEIKAGTKTVNQALREIKPEKEIAERKPYSNALQFSTIAISQLTRIRDEDPQRVAALLEVKEYVDNQLQKGV
jgi:ParB-like chromosome segregation protein Spo0J